MITRLALLLASVVPAGVRAQKGARLTRSQTEKFVLTAGPCAADGYWVTIQGGAFSCSDGSGFGVPSGHTLRSSWGASGTKASSGDDRHPAPERLRLTWFSYAEDAFYTGEFALPQEKIYQLLKQGSWDLVKQKQVTYNELTVCVLPKGLVVVWLTGGNQVLIGRFQAAAFAPSPAQYEHYYGRTNRELMVRNTRAELPAAVQAEIKAGTISTKKWDDYLTAYPWRIEFTQPLTLYRYENGFVNAERTSDPLTRDGMEAYRNIMLQPSPKARPDALYLFGTTEHGARYLIRVKAFDEAETKAAFQTVHAAAPTSPITLLFTIDKPFAKATLLLKNEAKQIPLTKSPVEVLSED